MGTCEHSPRLVLSCSCSGNRQTFSTKCTIVCHKPLPGSLETLSVDGCSAEAKILGPTFARNEPGLPNQ